MAASMTIRRQDEVKSRKSTGLFEGRYERLCLLGKGNFGKVYLARDIETGNQVAVKVIDKTSFKTNDQRKHALNEQAICETFSRHMKHKNIVDVYDVCSDDEAIYVAMEYIDGGELFEKIKENHKLEEPTARRWFREIVDAVGYIHKNGIVHRDLKPENVLIDKYQRIRICDFGFGKLCNREQVLSTYCGSPFYAAPEMVTATPYLGPPVDMWSCGVILYAMLVGTLPFQGEDMPRLFRRISTGSYTTPSYVSSDAANLISRLLCKSAKDRISAEECLEHPWLNKLPTPTPPLQLPSIATPPPQQQRQIIIQNPSSSSSSAAAQPPTPPEQEQKADSSSSSTAAEHQHTSKSKKSSRASRLFTRIFYKKKKVQVAPTRTDESKTTKKNNNNKLRAVENRMVVRVKGFFKTAFQRRLT